MKRALALAAWWLPATLAAAQGGEVAPRTLPARVLVAEQECTPARYELDATWKSLRVELAPLGVLVERAPTADDAEAQHALQAASAVIALECGDAPDALRLRVSDAASGKELVRSLSVADVAMDARPRALALALAGLLENSWSELLNAERAEQGALPANVQSALRERLTRKLAPATTSAARAQHRAVAPRPATDGRWDAELATRLFTGRGTALVGAQLGYGLPVTPRVHIPLVLETLFGRSELSDVSGRVGVMNLYSVTAGAGVRFRSRGEPTLELGPRVMLGAGLADPGSLRAGARASSKRGLLMSALVDAALRAPLGRAVLASAGIDFGYALLGIVFLGDQARLSGMADATFGAHVGLAW